MNNENRLSILEFVSKHVNVVSQVPKNNKDSFTSGTHGGRHHIDDLVATALNFLGDYYFNKAYVTDEPGSFIVVRTRDQEELDKCDICVDIGGKEFDHHYKGFNKRREDSGVKYASAGLVFNWLGKQLISVMNKDKDSDEIDKRFEEIEKSFILPVDANDNGELIDKQGNIITIDKNGDLKDKNGNLINEESILTGYELDYIDLFNPSWYETEPDYNGNFKKALECAVESLDNILRGRKAEKDKIESSSEEKTDIEELSIKYQNKLLENFSSVLSIMGTKEDVIKISDKIKETKNDEFLNYVKESVDEFLKEHSFEHNSKKQISVIIEQKIRQTVDEFYATKVIEVLAEDPKKMPYGCLLIPSQTMPWQKGVLEYNLKNPDNPIRFVMFPYPAGGWACQCVPPSPAIKDKYNQLTPFLSEVLNEYDKDIMGFIHAGRFFARTKADVKDYEAKKTLLNLCRYSYSKQCEQPESLSEFR